MTRFVFLDKIRPSVRWSVSPAGVRGKKAANCYRLENLVLTNNINATDNGSVELTSDDEIRTASWANLQICSNWLDSDHDRILGGDQHITSEPSS